MIMIYQVSKIISILKIKKKNNVIFKTYKGNIIMGCGCKNKQNQVKQQKTNVTRPSNPLNNGASGNGTRRVEKRIIR